jgi:hypothetical protein
MKNSDDLSSLFAGGGGVNTGNISTIATKL